MVAEEGESDLPWREWKESPAETAGDSFLMLIYLIRHAIAVPRGTPGVAEPDRPLAPEGVRKMYRIVRALRRLNVQFDQIWTSPLLRARQTAELLAQEMDLRKAIRDVDHLCPAADFTPIAGALADLDAEHGVALVGHEPDLGLLATWLLTGAQTAAIRFKKGGVACIQAGQIDPPSDKQLLWLLTPSQMIRLASDDA